MEDFQSIEHGKPSINSVSCLHNKHNDIYAVKDEREAVTQDISSKSQEDPEVSNQGLEVKLVAAARHLLETEGLESMSLCATAGAAGVSDMAPYRHFENKDALLAAVAEQGFWELSAVMDAVRRGNGVRTKIGVAYVSFAIDNPALFRLMFSPSLVARERFPGLVLASAAAFDKCLIASGAPAVQQGKVSDSAPKEAIALWALVHGVASLVLDGLVTLPAGPRPRARSIAEILEAMQFIPKL